MIDITPGTDGPAPNPPQAPASAGLRSLAMLSYVLFLIAWVNGVTAIIGVVIAYMKRNGAAGTIWQSHFENLIVVFWVTLIVFIAGLTTWPLALGALLAQGFLWPWPLAATLPLLFGLLVFPLFAVWFLYRTIRGLLRAGDDRAY